MKITIDELFAKADAIKQQDPDALRIVLGTLGTTQIGELTKGQYHEASLALQQWLNDNAPKETILSNTPEGEQIKVQTPGFHVGTPHPSNPDLSGQRSGGVPPVSTDPTADLNEDQRRGWDEAKIDVDTGSGPRHCPFSKEDRVKDYEHGRSLFVNSLETAPLTNEERKARAEDDGVNHDGQEA